MSREEQTYMYMIIQGKLFRNHDWQNDVISMGTIPPETTLELTGGLLEWSVNCEINRIISEGHWDQIISIGQLVPHEVHKCHRSGTYACKYHHCLQGTPAVLRGN